MNRNIKVILLLALISLVIFVLSLSSGTTFISPLKFWSLFTEPNSSPELKIILMFRLPRLIMALTLGSALAVSGVIFQAILKNPLSDPFTIGVSSGAALGASLGIIFHLNNILISLLALGGGFMIAWLVYLVGKKQNLSTATLILTGISLNFILSSAILLIFSLSESSQVHKTLLWMMGDLSIARYTVLWKLAPFLLIIVLISYLYHRHLDLISLGDDFSSSSGITKQDKQNLFWLATILAAIPVALAGVIGFVGLIIPHLTRFLFGHKHRQVIIFSALLGALFLVFCDIIARTIALPYEIPIGIITGFLGGSFFLFIMMTRGTR
jgi:iron complex transport system permease protein